MTNFRRVALLLMGVWAVACGHPKPVPPPPPPPPAYNVACVVLDADTRRPVEGALCKDGDKTGVTNRDGYFLIVNLPAGRREMFATAIGYQDNGTIYQNDHNQNVEVDLKSNWPQPQAFTPLVLEGDGPNGLICHHDLPPGVSFPDGPDPRVWRGDAWGVTIPGLPLVPGGSSRHPERALSWFFDRYSSASQHDILLAERRRGITHHVLSWPDSHGPRDNGPFAPPGNEQTLDQFVATYHTVNAAIPYVPAFLISKYFSPPHTAADALTQVGPVVDRLYAEGERIFVFCWECDTIGMSGQELEAYGIALEDRYPDADFYWHFTTYKTSWQPDGQPRAQFWLAQAPHRTGSGKLGLLYQGSQNDSCGTMSAHYNDAMVPASGLQAVGAVLVPFELVAMNEFDGDHPDEDDANARSWAVMSAPGPVPSSGYGNGARYPNGAPTLKHY